MKKYYKYGLVIVVLLIFTLLIFLWWKNNNVSSVVEKEKQFLPITPELQAKLDQHNLRMQTLKKAEEKYQKNKTDAQLEAEKKFAKKLAAVSESMLGEINFYGQAVDQHGDPIVGARIRYDAGGATFAKGSGKGETISNENGMFNIVGKGQGLSVSLSKNNHEFLPDYRFASFVDPEHPRAWPDYNTPDKSYIFKGWKVDEYAKTRKGEDKNFRFVGDGKEHVIDLIGSNPVIDSGSAGDFTVMFNVSETEWSFRVSSIEGGILETSDIYKNLAPETGYQPYYEYSSSEKTDPKNIKYDSLTKEYYFKSRGNTYGYMMLLIRPYHRDKASVKIKFYVINLEKGRNLTVKKQH
jgi:hypothetical protein